MKKRVDETDGLLKGVAKGIFEKKGSEVLKLDLRKLENRMADYFVICHGKSVTQVSSLCESVEETVRRETGEKPLHIEGMENCYWVLLDYGDVIVHIFLEEYRNFYSLESLWADADIEALIDEESKEQVYGRKQ
ncbi:MAG TPA: ribosome silencing factor [Bacteroidales bacterium]|nr:ribosome silencing factor [Bacteroidales bacterium]HPF03386.1 ribosome silencing factor [Bacteroidales bacterium]HPJ59563.1 ribosome silencing factor [Bacteroidales bacterium]HPR12976.1 ribosome silencing factor [Bacteroidales bacterium]HRW84696.1 ribosome silencing factor [Bacteroidales bacterium]